jgi:hypothetical protein
MSESTLPTCVAFKETCILSNTTVITSNIAPIGALFLDVSYITSNLTMYVYFDFNIFCTVSAHVLINFNFHSIRQRAAKQIQDGNLDTIPKNTYLPKTSVCLTIMLTAVALLRLSK